MIIIIYGVIKAVIIVHNKLEDGSYQAYSYPLGKYPWNITVLLSDKHLRSRILIIYSAAFCFYIVGVLISTSSHYMFSKKLVASINQMKGVKQKMGLNLCLKSFKFTVLLFKRHNIFPLKGPLWRIPFFTESNPASIRVISGF